MLHKAIQTIQSAIMAAAVVLVAIFFGTYGYYELFPMSHWIDYQKVRILLEGGGVSRIQVTRNIKEDGLFIIRLSEVKSRTPYGEYRHCQWNMIPPEEPPGQGKSVYDLKDVLGPLCTLEKINKEIVYLLITFDLTLPFDVHHRETFQVGPFQVMGGKMIYRGKYDVIEISPGD